MPHRRSPVPAAAVAALVALCLLLSGIAPSVSRVLAAEARASAHDLCVADGSAADAPPSRAPAGHHGVGDEPACALCAAHAGTHAAPPPASAPVAPAVVVDRSGALAGPARVAVRPVLAAAPRGPPTRAA